MTPNSKTLTDYFRPLISEFLSDLENVPAPDIQCMPEPFFPLFGSGYAQSALRMVIIGQDTKYWGDLKKFLADPRTLEGGRLEDSLRQFQEHEFTKWGPRRQTFFGFIMNFLAELHGQHNWQAMKHGEMTEILDTFAWGNGNSIEFFKTTAGKIGVPIEYWERVRSAGARFNKFEHIVNTLQPRVALILWRGMNPAQYFDGYDYEIKFSENRLTHYRLTEPGIDVFHAPHPGNMNRIEGTDYFRDRLISLVGNDGQTVVFPEFLAGQNEAKNDMEYLRSNAPTASADFDKYKFISWVADELAKRQTFMTVPALSDLLNQSGYRTNYGSVFQGVRGTYRLVAGAYHREVGAGFQDRARNIAVAFRKPNFEYAYAAD